MFSDDGSFSTRELLGYLLAVVLSGWFLRAFFLARLGGVSPSRITQIMNLRNLAPKLQEVILLPTVEQYARELLNEHSIRRISALADWRQQLVKFEHYRNPGNRSGK